MTTRRFAIAVGWLAGAYVPILALFWLLLRVPESNVLMLAASAALVLAIAALSGWVESVALLVLGGEPFGTRTLLRGLRGILPFVAALVLFGVIWWATGLAGAWWTGHRGEIDAWLIARFGWAETGWVHAAVRWVLVLARAVLGLSIALALFAAFVVPPAAAGPGRSRLRRWASAGFSPLGLLVLLGLLVVFAWLPWQAAYWRPSWLPPTSAEVVFVAAKLGLLYLLATVGWALALVLANRLQAR
ncbi:MAG: hypothetical protein H6Q10_3346 [Acidobacteria bacterium]|nr:hypothetical protein [Acidobacteriota bacterium]